MNSSMQKVLHSPLPVATVPDEAAVISILTLAFTTDPAARWMYPESDRYLAHFPDFIRAFAGNAFLHGGAHTIPEASAAALWLPPGVEPDEEEIVAHLQRSVSADRQDDLFALFEQMGRAHPSVPHWYLPLIGVDPAQQRCGHGSLLLRYVLERCDRERKPAYLEATSPENVSLYERHGFEVTGTIQAGTSLTLFAMLRLPQ